MDTTRNCRRPACAWPATASLSYRYATSQVWLLDLSPSPDPSLYDLCATHADATTVPRGWERVDERSPSREEVADAGRQLVSVAPGGERSPGPRAATVNRYDRLRRDLPRIAAQMSAERRVEPIPSRDLAPVAFRAAVARHGRASSPGQGQVKG